MKKIVYRDYMTKDLYIKAIIVLFLSFNIKHKMQPKNQNLNIKTFIFLTMTKRRKKKSGDECG